MGSKIQLTAGDGHLLQAYLAEPAGRPRGGIVVIQEIFGVTRHIRDVAEQFAAAGYLAVAPALFDRVEREVDVPYSDGQKGVGYVKALNSDNVMLDIQAAADLVRPAGKVGVVGYQHGFNCTDRPSFDAQSAKLAFDRSVEFFHQNVG